MSLAPEYRAACLDPTGRVVTLHPGEPFPANGLTWLLAGHPLPDPPDPLAALAAQFPLTAGDFADGFFRIGIESRPAGIALLCTFSRCSPEPEYIPIAVYVTQSSLLTVCKSPIPAFDELFDAWSCEPQEHGSTSSRLLYSVLDLCVDSFFPVVDELHDRIDDLEDRIFAENGNHSGEAIRIKKMLLTVRKNVSPLRENINSLIRIGQPSVQPGDLPEYQDLYNHSLRLAENIDLGRDMVSGLMDVQLSITGNRLNEIMRTLTIISTILMTSALIAGIYGMNFKFIPELDWKLGYPFAVGLMVLSGFGIYYWFRKLGFVGRD
ncbi:MAG: magnesium transporter CorA family protein [Armatimonadetes bacterium]|nr:magnesium transporter CorA family protein [Armatimonadota bacterium]MBS1710483.1 magnesium transporter CorA family protein [Armatimonadota bacterium]MBX3108154.1 magnesium transporter CorA family protein [Fimbriimonadaceae bacterium]